MKDNINELLIERLEEKGLDPDDFKDVLDAMKRPKYGLIWEDHPEHIEERMKYNRPVLCEEKELRIDSGYGYTNNILMEGDNLASLLAMREAGKKVDVIYIDPPYNTGNEFVYNDKIVDKEDSFKHSKWLSFMEKRLKVARDLMTDDGVIFVSIGDDEQANLKLLMDEVFGEENFISNVIYDGSLKNNSRFISNGHDYMLIYVKNKELLIENDVIWREEKQGLDLIFNFLDTLNKHGYQGDKTLDLKLFLKDNNSSLGKGLMAYNNIEFYNGEYRVYTSGDLSAPGGKGGDYDVYHPVTQKKVKKPKSGWRYSKATMDEKLQNNEILFGATEDKIPRFKRVLSKHDNIRQVARSYFWEERSTANKELNTIMGGKSFDFPKHVNVIKRWIKLVTNNNKNAKVLDFFAGSETTGHAVLELNKEDGGHRQFILCTNNENNICRDVTYERLRRVINGYTTPKGKEVEGLPANLMYLTVSDTPKENNDVMFDMDEKQPLKTHIINNLRLKHHLHHPDELVDNLYRLRNGNTVHYVYFNDYIEDGVEEAILESLDRDKTNIMHTVEGLVHDEAFNMMDDVKDIAGLLNE